MMMMMMIAMPLCLFLKFFQSPFFASDSLGALFITGIVIILGNLRVLK